VISPEELLAWKLRLFAAGAAFLLLGMALDRKVLVLAAIITLAGALLLRFLGRERPPPRDPSWDDPEE
jgi:hypothetical protein